MCVYTYIYVYIYVHTYAYADMYLYIYKYIPVHVYMYTYKIIHVLYACVREIPPDIPKLTLEGRGAFAKESTHINI